MKLLIACDMEGISGVVNWDHVTPGHAEYQRFRRIMTQDVNAAIAGAAAAGATEFLVTDGHWSGSNILVEELDPRAVLNCGSPSPMSMASGADAGVDAAFFIGYHARIGTPNAVLDHTWSSRRVANLWINGRLTGEFGLNAAVCGHYGVPALLISGDQSVCAEAREWVGEIETVQVKRASGRESASVLPPAVAQEKIRAGAEAAVRRFFEGKAPAPLQLGAPVTFTIEYFYTVMADSASLMPGVKRLDGRRIEFSAEDIVSGFRAFRAAVNLVSI